MFSNTFYSPAVLQKELFLNKIKNYVEENIGFLLFETITIWHSFTLYKNSNIWINI